MRSDQNSFLAMSYPNFILTIFCPLGNFCVFTTTRIFAIAGKDFKCLPFSTNQLNKPIRISNWKNCKNWKPGFLLWDLALTNHMNQIQNHDLWWDNLCPKADQLVSNQPKLQIKNFSKASFSSDQKFQKDEFLKINFKFWNELRYFHSNISNVGTFSFNKL